ncbi:NHLP leader peptide family RiPP precursor [Leptolyngbya sp. NIES-2104]|uniref:NHLP leader peptide family RiPP precursor n=1 Tax=Leptolyngbya sp. NIES-2104 TaxID=1552121 RepID=UPI0006EC54AF|nr:NHLP leader peptide family RiPP precursor [Leptolyngbya sp. NIES-2104]GAP94811.1 TOMM precursor peptide, NHLP family [Leptolyngbya sp. NIES-2104]
MPTNIDSRKDVETQIVAHALKDDSFKQQLLNNPDAAKAEVEKLLGQKAQPGFKVQVLQETADTAYIVLPYVPSTEGMTEEQLEAVASGTVSIGGNLQVPCILGSATFTSGINIQAGL